MPAFRCSRRTEARHPGGHPSCCRVLLPHASWHDRGPVSASPSRLRPGLGGQGQATPPPRYALRGIGRVEPARRHAREKWPCLDASAFPSNDADCCVAGSVGTRPGNGFNDLAPSFAGVQKTRSLGLFMSSQIIHGSRWHTRDRRPFCTLGAHVIELSRQLCLAQAVGWVSSNSRVVSRGQLR